MEAAKETKVGTN